jgi:hypothetical protein
LGFIISSNKTDNWREHRRVQLHYICTACEKNRQRDLVKTLDGKASELFTDCRSRAARAALEFHLRKEWFVDKLVAGICERTGIAFEYEPGSPWVPSPDRLDSNIGYTPANCQMVCWIYNQAKNNFGDETLYELCETVVKYRTLRSRRYRGSSLRIAQIICVVKLRHAACSFEIIKQFSTL